MRLDELLADIHYTDLLNVYPDTEVSRITADSRKVTPGSIFVAIQGSREDGHNYISDAVEAGATLVIQSNHIDQNAIGSFVRVHDPRKTYALLTAKLYGNPSRRLRVIGVTGTNGKTSTVLIARHILNAGGYKAAALGTLGLVRPEREQPEKLSLTTPDASDLQQIIDDLVSKGATHLVMEVSSHALVQHRVVGVEFAGGVFTNISQDHYDYHGSYEDYLAAKSLLFNKYLAESGGYAAVNGDDKGGREILQQTGSIAVRYGCGDDCNLVIGNIANSIKGLEWSITLKNGIWPDTLTRDVNYTEVNSPLIGRYHVYNCTAAMAIALLEGMRLDEVVSSIGDFHTIPGRLQYIPNSKGVHPFVDYAHTPDALDNVLKSLIETKDPGQRIVTVFGCGGDRDRSKRPQMGAVVSKHSDVVVVTSDNPRGEEPQKIIDEIFVGIKSGGKSVERISDRRKAIHAALDLAAKGDIILIAGKGHEEYQILTDKTIHFSDVQEVDDYLNHK